MEDGKIKILYEDNHLIVVEKPINMLVQSDNTHDLDLQTLIKKYLKELYSNYVIEHKEVLNDISRLGIEIYDKFLTMYNDICKNEDVTSGFVAPFLFIFLSGWWSFTDTRAAQTAWSTFGLQTTSTNGMGGSATSQTAVIGFNNGLLFVLFDT